MEGATVGRLYNLLTKLCEIAAEQQEVGGMTMSVLVCFKLQGLDS